MNDITALAQRMKAAAEKATPGAYVVGHNDINRHGGLSSVFVCQEYKGIAGGVVAECHVNCLTKNDDQVYANAEFIAATHPANVLALVEALDTKEEQRANWFHVAQKLGEDLDAAEKRIAELEKAASEPVAWTDEQELRDVERNGCGYLFTVNPITPHADPRRVIKLYTAPPALESHTVTVKLPAEKFCPAEYAGSQLWSETEVWNKAITACADVLRAAGIQVIEGEQKNG